MSSIGDGDRSDSDQNEKLLTVWDFFHHILSGRTEFRRLMILLIVLLAGLALVAVVLTWGR